MTDVVQMLPNIVLSNNIRKKKVSTHCAKILLSPPIPVKREREEEEVEGWVIGSLKWQKAKGLMEREKKKSANKGVSPDED